MKIVLLNGAEYEIEDIKNNGGTLEIQFVKDTLTAEQAETAFGDRASLQRIEVYGKVKKTSELLSYVVLSEIKLKSGIVIAVLSKEADTKEQRITEAAAKAVEAMKVGNKANEVANDALEAAKEVKNSTEQIIANMDYLAMEMGVEV